MILPTAYFPPIGQVRIMLDHPKYALDHFENFVKQTYRNRCEIHGANGRLKLVIPLQKWRNHTPVKDILISYEENWQGHHWKSIESAYRTSPYFEFYEADIFPFFKNKTFKFLVDFNEVTLEMVNQLLELEIQREVTENYVKSEDGRDWRKAIHPKEQTFHALFDYPKYIQVFEERNGFLPNLSILDLLFNLGPNTKSYLENMSRNYD